MPSQPTDAAPQRNSVAAAWRPFRTALLTLVAFPVLSSLSFATEGRGELRIENGRPGTATRLHGQDARLQLIVSAELPDGEVRDWTHRVAFSVDPPELATVDQGLVTPLASGTVTITARGEEGQEAQTTLEITGFGEALPISFPGQIVPIFTKFGCNSGGCHGKIAGQNGFRLSLLGFEPREDYEHLVHESRGRRISPATPERSLLLEKAVGSTPHGGGPRLETDAPEYRLLQRWIARGVPYGDGNEPTVESIAVFPAERRLPAGAEQQLSVVATYSDGSIRDVTRAALYESNDPSMAEATSTGRVKLGTLAGDVAVMARYQGHVTVFRAVIPMSDAPAVWTTDNAPQPRNVVDKFVFEKLESLGIPPSSPCDDPTFLRRATLDITGRLPTVAEAEAFLADAAEDKRERLIERLLASDEYAEFFAAKWNTILRNRRTGGGLEFATVAFHDWIKQSFRENKPYDEFVQEILTASGSVASNPPVVWLRQVSDTNARVEDAAQLFLGQRIQCARCHHHPFEKWSQQDYAQLSAFFTTVAKKKDRDPSEPTFVSQIKSATAPHPKTGQAFPPAGLEGEAVDVAPFSDPRSELVEWMTDPANPFFARVLVNRYWKHFMGRGLVEPEDDMRVTNPPSNPELLDAMSRSFVESGYDLKALIRLITSSKTYALSHDALEANLADRRSHARFYPKRLTAEVLLDAVDRVTGTKTRFEGMPPATRAVALPDTGFNSYFLEVFGQPDSATVCECERSQEANLAQSLHLLNSEQIQGKLADDGGRAARMAADTAKSDEAHVRELYLLALSRPPRGEELQNTLDYLATKEDRREAFEDIIWALINSKEFVFNH